MLDQLNFHENMRKEANRIRETEVAVLVAKKASVERRLEQLNETDVARLFMN